MFDRQDDAQPSRYLVRAEFMQSYTTASPFAAGVAVAAALDRNGQPQVFSLGSDNDLYQLAVGEDERHWRAFKMRAPATVKDFAVGRGPDGHIVVFAAGTDNHLYWISDRPFQGWTDLGTPFAGADVTLARIRTGYDTEGMLLAMVRADSPTGGQMICKVQWNDTDVPWDYVSPPLQPGNVIYDFAPGSTPSHDGAFAAGSYVEIEAAAVAFFGTNRKVPLRTEYRNQTNDMVTLTGVTPSGKSTRTFGIDEQGVAWVIGDGVDHGSVALTGSSNTKLVCIRAGVHKHGDIALLEVFAIGENNTLYHARQAPGEGGATVWSQLVPLGGSLLAGANALAICGSESGMSQCFAVTSDGNLVWFTQNQNLEWDVRTVAVAHQGTLEEFASYSTEIALIDQNGTPMPAKPLLAYISVDARVILNGRAYATGPHNAIACTTNAAGRITVVVPTLSIGTPSLIIDGGALEDGYVLNIRPDQSTQGKIEGPPATASALEIKRNLENATVNGQPLVPYEYSSKPEVMTGVSEAILNSFSLAQQDEGQFEKWHKVADPRGDMRGVRVLPRAAAFSQADAIDTKRVPEQHWHIRFTAEGPIYTALRDRAEAVALIAQLSGGAADFDFSLRPDWGTLWSSVRRGVTVLADVVVTTLTEIVEEGKSFVSRIEACITTKLKQAYNYIVDKVQMTFDIVQGVFEAIAVKFEDLFQWLGTLFAWQDVLSVKTIVKSMINQVLKAAPQQIENVWTSVTAGLRELAGAAPPDLGPYGSTTLGEASQKANEDATGKAPGPSSNFVQSQILDNGGGGPGELGVDLNFETAASALNAIFQFFQEVEQAAASEIPAIIEAFRQFLFSGDSITKLSLNDMLKVFESKVLTLAVTVMDAALPLVQNLFNAVRELVNHKWDIPVLSKLYRTIDPGNELTLIDLLSLAMAVPATFAMKAMPGAVFPDLGGMLSAQTSPGQLFGALNLQVAYTPPQDSDAAVRRGAHSDQERFAMAAVGYAFSAGIFLTWAVNTARFLAKEAVGNLPWLDTVWRMLGAALGACTYALSCDFIFEPEIKTTAQKWMVANYVVIGVQLLAADIVPAVVQLAYNARASWHQAFALYLMANGSVPIERGVREYVEQMRSENPFGRRRPPEWLERLTQIAGFLCSAYLFAGFTVQSYYEIDEVMKDGTKREVNLAAAKLMQNLCTTLDHLALPFEGIASKTPEGKAIYCAVTGFGNVTATIVNGLRAYASWPDIPHLNM